MVVSFSPVAFVNADGMVEKSPLKLFGYRIGQKIKVDATDYDETTKWWSRRLPIIGGSHFKDVLVYTTSDGSVVSVFAAYDGDGAERCFRDAVVEVSVLLGTEAELKCNKLREGNREVEKLSVKWCVDDCVLKCSCKVKIANGKPKEHFSISLDRKKDEGL